MFALFFITVVVCHVILIISSYALSSASSSPSFIRSQYTQKQPSASTNPEVLLEHYTDLLGPTLCFTERDSFSMIQLCLEHGFRRVELEKMSHFVVSSKPGSGMFSEVEIDLASDEEKLARRKRKKKKNSWLVRTLDAAADFILGDDDDEDEENDNENGDKPRGEVEKQQMERETASIFLPSAFVENQDDDDDKHEKYLIRKPMSRYLKQELEDFFSAVADADSYSLDDAFSKHRSRYSSLNLPFRSEPRQVVSKRSTDKSALANISTEVYGRYDPHRSRIKIIGNGGEAEIMYPNGDRCYHHHERQSEDDVVNWTTYLRFVCSMDSVGVRKEEEKQSAAIKWDVRVNAPQCMVIVIVFTEVMC